MRRFFTRRWLSASAIGLVLFISAVSFVLWDGRPSDVREFAAIREDWERTIYGHAMSGNWRTMLADRKAKPLTQAEKAAKIVQLAESCLKHAEKHPHSASELAALYLAASRGSHLEQGTKALDLLNARILTADLGQLDWAIHSSYVSSSNAIQGIAPGILDRVKQSPDQPKAAAMLTFVCKSAGWDSETEEPPPHFAEAADPIASRYADSPDIFNFCEILGNGLSGSPHWADRFERHLRTILEVNQDRWVRCTASMALASIAQSADDRQEEAERLYEKLLADFDGQTKYMGQNVEQEYRRRAALQLKAIRFSPTGRLAPEIVGVDLDGRPMALSEYRGKVVLLSFWATWCPPCMKLIPHERELARRLQDRPFAIVGVNGDGNEVDAVQYGITWRSFRDERPGMGSISDEWTAFFPTLLLIDHKGIMRKRFTGSPPPEVLDRMVDDLVEAAEVE